MLFESIVWISVNLFFVMLPIYIYYTLGVLLSHCVGVGFSFVINTKIQWKESLLIDVNFIFIIMINITATVDLHWWVLSSDSHMWGSTLPLIDLSVSERVCTMQSTYPHTWLPPFLVHITGGDIKARLWKYHYATFLWILVI